MIAARRAPAARPIVAARKAVDNGGLRYGAVEGALRPPLPTATPSPAQRAASHLPSVQAINEAT